MKEITWGADHFLASPTAMMPYRSAGEKVADETEHLHDDVHLGVGKQAKQVVIAERTQHLRLQLLFRAERHVLMQITDRQQ